MDLLGYLSNGVEGEEYIDMVSISIKCIWEILFFIFLRRVGFKYGMQFDYF